MIDPVTVQRLSQKQGIDRYTILREYIQLLYLNELYTFPESKKLVFKGGTALRFLFNSNRFSEDLDFTTTMSPSEIVSLSDQVVKNLSQELPQINIATLKTLIGLSRKISLPTGISSQPLTIKLDFSDRELVVLPKQGLLQTILPIRNTSVITYLDFPEILAEKWRAIATRKKGRDLYDMWFLLAHGVVFDQPLIQKKLDYYQEVYNSTELISKISSWNQQDLDNDLRRFLPEKDRGAISVLKAELLSLLNRALQP